MSMSHTSTQPTLRGLVAMETFKLRKRPMTKIIFGLITAGFALVMAIGYVLTRTSRQTGEASQADPLQGFLLPDIIPNGLQIIGDVGGILLVILAATLVGSEYGWGTVRVLVGSGVSRTRVLAAKSIALTEYAALFVLAGFASGCATSVILMLAGGHDLALGSVEAADSTDVLLMLMRTTFVVLVPAILAFTVATISRSTAAGIGIGIGITILEAVLTIPLSGFGASGETIRKAFILTNIDALQAVNAFGSPAIPNDLPDPSQAAAVLTLYSIVLLGLAFIVFCRRDIASGSSG